jgi:hypothetical protein
MKSYEYGSQLPPDTEWLNDKQAELGEKITTARITLAEQTDANDPSRFRLAQDITLMEREIAFLHDLDFVLMGCDGQESKRDALSTIAYDLSTKLAGQVEVIDKLNTGTTSTQTYAQATGILFLTRGKLSLTEDLLEVLKP